MCPFHIRDVPGHFCAVPVHSLTAHNSPLQSAPCRSQGTAFPSHFSHLQKPVLPKFPSLVRSLTHETNKNMKKISAPPKSLKCTTGLSVHICTLTIASLYELSGELGNEKSPFLGHRVLLWGDRNVLEPGKGSGCSPWQLAINPRTQLLALKWLILCYVSFTSIFKTKSKLSASFR